MKRSIAKLCIIWLGFVFLSPGLGIHVHHERSQFYSLPIIHSYFFPDHDEEHPLHASDPETLADHILNAGISKDFQGWDGIPFLSYTSNHLLTNVFLKSLIFLLFVGFAFFLRWFANSIIHELVFPYPTNHSRMVLRSSLCGLLGYYPSKQSILAYITLPPPS